MALLSLLLAVLRARIHYGSVALLMSADEADHENRSSAVEVYALCALKCLHLLRLHVLPSSATFAAHLGALQTLAHGLTGAAFA